MMRTADGFGRRIRNKKYKKRGLGDKQEQAKALLSYYYLKMVKSESEASKSSSHDNNTNSIHESIPREFSGEDIFDKYEILHVLGVGSMGEVASVKVRKGKVGGSAFVTKRRGIFGLFKFKERTGRLKERSSEHEYALKSIIIDRVSPTFVKELQNEINILRTLDHPNVVKLYEVYTVSFLHKKAITILICFYSILFLLHRN